MKFFRYRAPSIKTVLGITHAKKAINKAVGITAAMKPVRWLSNTKRTAKRKAGYYSAPGKVIRNGLPTPGGCLLPIVGALLLVATVIMLAAR
jgi:hypothetical protein